MTVERSSAGPPWLWIGAGVAMIVAIVFGILDDDTPGEFEALARAAQNDGQTAPGNWAAQQSLDDIIGAGPRDSRGALGYEPPDISQLNREEIRIVRGDDTLEVVSVATLLDGDTYEQTTSSLVAETGRERTGVLLQDLLERSDVGDWSHLVMTDATGFAIDVYRDELNQAPEQFLLYPTSDGDPSATVSLIHPGTFEPLVDVVHIAIVE